ncbi:RNA polymerase sigma-70 factor [Bacteroidota bacterium]
MLILSVSEQTIKQLFDELFHQLALSAYRYVNDYGQAEEIVQDVFVKVWQNFDELKEIKDLKGYLFRAVQNSSLNFLKHLKVRQKFIEDSEVLNISMEKSHEETISEEETKIRIHQAVNKLPDNWREAFVLSKYNKLKYHEIAEDMNISQKTVEKYISKALQFLRIELKDLILVSICVMKFLFEK